MRGTKTWLLADPQEMGKEVNEVNCRGMQRKGPQNGLRVWLAKERHLSRSVKAF